MTRYGILSGRRELIVKGVSDNVATEDVVDLLYGLKLATSIRGRWVGTCEDPKKAVACQIAICKSNNFGWWCKANLLFDDWATYLRVLSR